MPSKADTALRQQIIDTCVRMNSMGINQGTSGNVSARVDGGILVTPSATPYDQLAPADVVFISTRGQREKRADGKVPSTEWRFHLDILNSRREMAAVVHTHSAYAAVLSTRRQDIPALHYMIAVAGGPRIRCSGYATYGTAELSACALKALDGMNACLLANHGVIALGPSLAKALWLANEVEVLAKQFVYASLLGGPTILPDSEIARVKAKMQEYGLKS